MLARHGYGVLALDNPGNGESEGHSNGLGDNAQPAIRAGPRLARAAARRRSATASPASALSLGGEVLLEAAARDRRLARRRRRRRDPPDGRRGTSPIPGPPERVEGWLMLPDGPRRLGHAALAVAASASCRASRRDRCCSSPSGGFPAEIPASRRYRDAGGRSVAAVEAAGHGPHRRAAHASGRVRAAHRRRSSTGRWRAGNGTIAGVDDPFRLFLVVRRDALTTSPRRRARRRRRGPLRPHVRRRRALRGGHRRVAGAPRQGHAPRAARPVARAARGRAARVAGDPEGESVAALPPRRRSERGPLLERMQAMTSAL